VPILTNAISHDPRIGRSSACLALIRLTNPAQLGEAPLLVRGASEVRATVAATASKPTGLATPDEIAVRVDLTST